MFEHKVPGAAWSNTWLLIKLTLQGVDFFFKTRGFDAIYVLTLASSCVFPSESHIDEDTQRPCQAVCLLRVCV